MLEALGRFLARRLSQPREGDTQVATSAPEKLAATLEKGDVLLIEGNSRFSAAVKYLTQSSWSHAALFVGDALGPPPAGAEPNVLIDADINNGVRAVPLSTYSAFHTRICRPVGLSPEEIGNVVAHAVSRLGQKYDLKNVWDLARFMIHPPVPGRYRRRLLSLGSGDPTRAICSTLIAEAFQSVKYPILPTVVLSGAPDRASRDSYAEVLRIRHHSHFAPRDFDVSPYFQIVKPAIAQGFDPHELTWETSDRTGTGV